MKQSGPEYLIPFCVQKDSRCVKGPCLYDASAEHGIFQIINKSLKSASRDKDIPVSQHDSGQMTLLQNSLSGLECL